MKNRTLIVMAVVCCLTAIPLIGQQARVTICHFDATGTPHELRVAISSVAAHKGLHSDYDPFAFYVDQDQDGFGTGTPLFACLAPAGYVDDDSDCNDSDPSIHPSAEEVCGDSLDNDCNGEVDESCVGCVDLLLHCNLSSQKLQTVCGDGPQTLQAFTRSNASAIVLGENVTGVTLTNCSGASYTVYDDTLFCSLPGGCCSVGRFNDNICGLEIF